MNLQSCLGLSLAGVSLVLSIGFFLHDKTVPLPKPDIPSMPSAYTEPMPEWTDESYRTHILNAAGTESEIRIKYKDKSEGLLLFANGKTVLERRSFPDGSRRKEANFDENGVLLSGFEYRSDRTLLWQTAKPEGQSKTFTRVYWPSGKLFLEREYELDTQISHSRFRRISGVLWQESEYRADQLISLASYDDEGRISILQKSVLKTGAETSRSQMFGNSQPDPVLEIVYFKQDGTPDFGQRIGYAARYFYNPASGLPNPNPLIIIGVDIYLDGNLFQKYELYGDHKVKVADDIQPDGTIRRHYAQPGGMITREDFITSSGVSTQYDFEGRFGSAPVLDERYLVSRPDNNAPIRQFNYEEAGNLE